MSYLNRSIVSALAGIIALGSGSTTMRAQAIVDLENRYPNVGVIMVWRVDSAGKPVELHGFASGTLIRDRVMVTAGHFTGPATALGTLPPSVRLFASFSPTEAKDPKTWIPTVRYATHPSMPRCPPPRQCDPTDDILVAPLEPGIADVGLWDGKRCIRSSTLRKVVDETWALWSIPSYVCSGDSGGGIFLNPGPNGGKPDILVANVSDGGRDCRRHNNNNRLDTRGIQNWIAARTSPSSPRESARANGIRRAATRLLLRPKG